MIKNTSFTLVTSLDYVSIGPVRTMTHALLLESGDDEFFKCERHRLRGFSVEACLPTFDLDLPTGEFTMIDAQSQHVFIGSNGNLKPLVSGARMRFAGFDHDIQLIALYRSTLDVCRLPSSTDYIELWRELAARVAHHWIWPNMPVINLQPTARARIIAGRPEYPITSVKS